LAVFDEILLKGIRSGQVPARTRASRTWFRNTAAKASVGKDLDSMSKLIKEQSRIKNTPVAGRMYFFFYNPKHKKTLPYYDKFPLIFKIRNVPDGFLGINLHYLPHAARAKLMDALYSLTTDKRYDEKTKLQLSYRLLNGASKFKYFRPTVKMYLNNHVKSKFLLIDSVEWDIALFLPVENFAKASKEDVWADSVKKIKGK